MIFSRWALLCALAASLFAADSFAQGLRQPASARQTAYDYEYSNYYAQGDDAAASPSDTAAPAAPAADAASPSCGDAAPSCACEPACGCESSCCDDDCCCDSGCCGGGL